MSQEWEGHLDSLYQLMEDEIFHYHLLAGEIKKESEYLKKGSTESLMESLHSLEILVTAIQKIQESIGKTTEKILNSMGSQEKEKTLSNLMETLPSQESRKIRSYQNTLEKLKRWVRQINARNITFAQESLAYGQDLFSLLVHSLGESPVYIQNGTKPSPPHPPYSLNRKV